jgi:hypothetical protein
MYDLCIIIIHKSYKSIKYAGQITRTTRRISVKHGCHRLIWSLYGATSEFIQERIRKHMEERLKLHNTAFYNAVRAGDDRRFWVKKHLIQQTL